MTHSWQIIRFPKFQDQRGSLIPFELDESFPFLVKRVYLVTGENEATRGAHAHKIESELFLVTSGSVEITLNNGNNEETILLNDSQTSVFVPTNCWHEFNNFSKDAVLLCFSSTHYLPGAENYITNKQEFLASFKNV